MTKKTEYPDRPGFVVGSDTSEGAADSLDDDIISRLRLRIYKSVIGSPRGAICDEIERRLGLSHQTASPRLRELELTGWLYKSDDRRLTRRKRFARVYQPTGKKLRQKTAEASK